VSPFLYFGRYFLISGAPWGVLLAIRDTLEDHFPSNSNEQTGSESRGGHESKRFFGRIECYFKGNDLCQLAPFSSFGLSFKGARCLHVDILGNIFSSPKRPGGNFGNSGHPGRLSEQRAGQKCPNPALRPEARPQDQAQARDASEARQAPLGHEPRAINLEP
jgi:hypothetical protein